MTAGKSEADRVFDKTKFDKSVFRILRQAWLNFFREEKANILQADCQPLIFLAQRKYSDQIHQLKDARLAGETENSFKWQKKTRQLLAVPQDCRGKKLVR